MADPHGKCRFKRVNTGDRNMKACIFCKKDIADDCIKCPYCQSYLVPIATTDSTEGKDEHSVVYIVDKGIIRFGKFCAGAVAILLILGAYVFGIDLKSTVNEMRVAEQLIRESRVNQEQLLSILKQHSRNLRRELANTISLLMNLMQLKKPLSMLSSKQTMHSLHFKRW